MPKKLILYTILLFGAVLHLAAQKPRTEMGLDQRPPMADTTTILVDSVDQVRLQYSHHYSDNLDLYRVDIDTALNKFHVYNPIFRESISNINLGNLGSAYISNVYFDRPEVDFMFSDVYHAYMKTPDLLPIVNTKTPFSILSYGNGGPKKYAEETVNGIFSQNVNENLNIGLYFDILYAIGRYTHSSTRNKNFGGFSSYSSPRYNALLNIGTARMEGYENGGIGDSDGWIDSYINDPNSSTVTATISDQPESYPVRLTSANSFLKHSFIEFNHKYNLGVMRDVPQGDTTIQEFVSAVNLVHKFKYETNIKQYDDTYTSGAYYDTAYIHNSSTLDSLRSRTISNRLGLYLDEDINEFGKFGLGAYLQLDNVYIANTPWNTSIEDSTLSKGFSDMLADDSNIAMDSARHEFIKGYDGYRYNNVTFGGSIFKRQGTHFFFDAAAEICLAGYNAGDWKLDGTLRQVFPNMAGWELSARAKLERKQPDYIEQHYYSNNFWWDNDFSASTTQSLGGTLKIPAINFEASVDIDNIQDQIYFNEFAMPAQANKNLAVLAVRVKKDFELGRHVVWENDFVYQETSDSEVMPLPQFTVYSNLYYKNILFKVLHFNIGADCRYHSAYYAPGYMPATGRFYNQKDVQIGNYPMMNVYADFFLRRMRFFVMETHVNYGWPSLEYFSAPHYGYNHRMFKMGLQWTFYD